MRHDHRGRTALFLIAAVLVLLIAAGFAESLRVAASPDDPRDYTAPLAPFSESAACSACTGTRWRTDFHPASNLLTRSRNCRDGREHLHLTCTRCGAVLLMAPASAGQRG